MRVTVLKIQLATTSWYLRQPHDQRLLRKYVASDENYAAAQERYVPSNRKLNFVTRMLALHGDLLSTSFMTEGNVLGSRTLLGAIGYIILKDVLAKWACLQTTL